MEKRTLHQFANAGVFGNAKMPTRSSMEYIYFNSLNGTCTCWINDYNITPIPLTPKGEPNFN